MLAALSIPTIQSLHKLVAFFLVLQIFKGNKLHFLIKRENGVEQKSKVSYKLWVQGYRAIYVTTLRIKFISTQGTSF